MEKKLFSILSEKETVGAVTKHTGMFFERYFVLAYPADIPSVAILLEVSLPHKF